MCACQWDRLPHFGDVIIQQCADHAAVTAAQSRITNESMELTAQLEMDREIDKAIALPRRRDPGCTSLLPEARVIRRRP